MENNKQLWHKNIRLQKYDYSQCGYYFITICTNNRDNILCNIAIPDILIDAKATPCICPEVNLTDIGLQVNNSILKIPILYKEILIDQYVIMPNHIHMILIFTRNSMHGSLPLQDVIGRFKSYTTYLYNQICERKGLILWQRNFYEHVIRNEQSLNEIQKYIVSNPVKWYEDKYYTK